MSETPNLDSLDQNLQTAEDAIQGAQADAQAIRELYEAMRPEDVVPLAGCSMSKWDHKAERVPVARCYNPEDVDDAVRLFGATDICYSMDAGSSPQRMQDEAQRVIDTYPAIAWLWIARGNEVNRHVTSPSGIANYCDAMDEVQAALHEIPRTFTALNITGWGIKEGNVQPFEPCAPYIDLWAPNPYPPGRKDSPPTQTPFADYVNRCMDLGNAWGIKQVGCWEQGTPVSSKYNRPAYMADHARYCRDYATSLGMVFRHATYWDSVKLKNGQPDPNEPDNRFQNDGTATADAWYAAFD